MVGCVTICIARSGRPTSQPNKPIRLLVHYSHATLVPQTKNVALRQLQEIYRTVVHPLAGLREVGWRTPRLERGEAEQIGFDVDFFVAKGSQVVRIVDHHLPYVVQEATACVCWSGRWGFDVCVRVEGVLMCVLEWCVC